MDGIELNAASRVYPTCGDKPGHDKQSDSSQLILFYAYSAGWPSGGVAGGVADAAAACFSTIRTAKIDNS